MPNFAFGVEPLNSAQLEKVDPRLLQFISNWNITENYDNKIVTIPDVFPFNYYYVVRSSTDPDYKADHSNDEAQLSLWCGWKGNPPDSAYDAEVIINLRLTGTDVLNKDSLNVTAEILKSGGAPMQVFYNNKLVTDFTTIINTTFLWWSKTITTTNGYITTPNMYNFL